MDSKDRKRLARCILRLCENPTKITRIMREIRNGRTHERKDMKGILSILYGYDEGSLAEKSILYLLGALKTLNSEVR